MTLHPKTFHAVFLLSLPLLAEVVRKYGLHSDVVLLAADIFVIVTALLFVAHIGRSREVLIVALLMLVSVAWGLITVALGHQNLLLGLIGLRSLLVPSAFFIAAYVQFKRLGYARAAAIYYRVSTTWFLIILAVAVAQLLAGRDHWLNQLPEGFGDERHGVGDYTVGELGVDFLFRPTSIFLHTGKMGAVLFLLAAYRLSYQAFATKVSLWRFWFHRGLDLLALVLSGQRAAILGYMLFWLLIVAIRGARRMTLRGLAGGLAVALAALILLSLASKLEEAGDGLGGLLAGRVISGIQDVAPRAIDNVVRPSAYVFKEYGWSPAGMGAFSLGSGRFGGRPLYDLVPIGTAENSWLRILAEQGFPGLAFAAAFWGVIFGLGLRACYKARGRTDYFDGQLRVSRDITIYGPAVLLIFVLWANTHDIMGNVTVMSILMTAQALVFCACRNSLASPLFTIQRWVSVK